MDVSAVSWEDFCCMVAPLHCPISGLPGERKTWNQGRQTQISSQITALGRDTKQGLHHSQTLFYHPADGAVQQQSLWTDLTWQPTAAQQSPYNCQGCLASGSLQGCVPHFSDLVCVISLWRRKVTFHLTQLSIQVWRCIMTDIHSCAVREQTLQCCCFFSGTAEWDGCFLKPNMLLDL